MSLFQPTDEQDLSDMLRSADAPVRVLGGDTRGEYSDPATQISTAKMSGIVDYVPGALTMIAKSGTPLSEIEALLAKEGQQLAFEPYRLGALLGRKGSSTIGGVFATNASGSRRIQAGAARDFLLGVRFVDGEGHLIKNGGRVMKNVTGYDLVKLMCGSWGTLGIMSEVAFKTLPAPELTQTLVLHQLDHAQAVAAMSQALGSSYEVSGTVYLCATQSLYLRVEGFSNSVSYRVTALRALLGEYGEQEVLDHDASLAFWSDLRDVSPLKEDKGDIWRISVQPSDGVETFERAGFRTGFYDWSGGLIWGSVAAGTDLRARLGHFEGHATRLRGLSETVPKFQPQPEALARLSQGLRKQFDPRGLLNPGLIG